MAKFRKLGQFIGDSMSEFTEKSSKEFQRVIKRSRGDSLVAEGPEEGSDLPEDPRFGLAGTALLALQKKRKKQSALAASQAEESKRAAKAFDATVLTSKEEVPSLLG